MHVKNLYPYFGYKRLNLFLHVAQKKSNVPLTHGCLIKAHGNNHSVEIPMDSTASTPYIFISYIF